MRNAWISRRPFVVAAAVFASILSVAQEARCADKKAAAKHFLWVVKSKTATVYMLGSVHAAKKSLYPLDDVIETAFKKSDTLVLEVAMDEESKIKDATKLRAAGSYGKGESLDKALSKNVKKKLAAYLTKRMAPGGIFNKFRPWLVSVALTMEELKNHGFVEAYGIDQHFLSQSDGKKKIIALETTDDRVKMFKSLTAKDQEKMLDSTLDDIDKVGEMMTEIFKAWKSGNSAQLDELILKPLRKPEQKSVLKAIITDRNIKMTKKIEGFLKTESTYFVVVGSGHLIGKEGIVELLRKKKLKVDQL